MREVRNMAYKINVRTSEYKNGRKRVLRLKALKGGIKKFKTKRSANRWIKKQINPKKYTIIK